MTSTLNKAQKLVKIVDLMTRRGGVSSSELMERFDLDGRTLRRYLADLRGLDLPITDEGRGDDRVITIDPRWRRTGVRLSLAEVLSLHFGRKLFNFLDGTSFADDLSGAIERLEPAISRTHRDLARQLDTKFFAVGEHIKDYRGDGSELIDEAVTALVYNNPLVGRYRKANGVESSYQLHPYTLAIFRQGLYVFALDLDAQRVKTFALERFTDLVRRRQEYFEFPAGWQPGVHLAHAFGIISGTPELVRIRFSDRVAAYVQERTWHPTQVLNRLPDGRVELTLQVAIQVELVSWILGFGEDALVLEPKGLVERVRATVARAWSQYEGSSER